MNHEPVKHYTCEKCGEGIWTNDADSPLIEGMCSVCWLTTTNHEPVKHCTCERCGRGIWYNDTDPSPLTEGLCPLCREKKYLLVVVKQI